MPRAPVVVFREAIISLAGRVPLAGWNQTRPVNEVVAAAAPDPRRVKLMANGFLLARGCVKVPLYVDTASDPLIVPVLVKVQFVAWRVDIERVVPEKFPARLLKANVEEVALASTEGRTLKLPTAPPLKEATTEPFAFTVKDRLTESVGMEKSSA